MRQLILFTNIEGLNKLVKNGEPFDSRGISPTGRYKVYITKPTIESIIQTLEFANLEDWEYKIV